MKTKYLFTKKNLDQILMYMYFVSFEIHVCIMKIIIDNEHTPDVL